MNSACPWSGKPIQADSLTLYKDKVVGFCNPGCRDKFEAAARLFDSLIEPQERRRKAVPPVGGAPAKAN
jgi:hypothetical protein